MLSAAREGATGRVIAVVQPHRYTRLHDLMDEFQGAFNDADIVLVAPVYAAGEAPIEGVEPREPGRGAEAARPSRRRRSWPTPHDVCRQLAGLAAPGDMVICLGAGDITKWAAGLADGIRAARAARMSGAATLAKVGGKLTADAPLAPLVWFKSGGAAEWLFEPKDVDDLQGFLAELDPAVPVMALGLGSNLIVRDGGVPRRGRSARQGRSPGSSGWSATDDCAAAAARAASSSPRRRATRASPASNSCARSPARSAASCG